MTCPPSSYSPQSQAANPAGPTKTVSAAELVIDRELTLRGKDAVLRRVY